MVSINRVLLVSFALLMAVLSFEVKAFFKEIHEPDNEDGYWYTAPPENICQPARETTNFAENWDFVPSQTSTNFGQSIPETLYSPRRLMSSESQTSFGPQSLAPLLPKNLSDTRLTGPLIDLARGLEKTAEVDLIAPLAPLLPKNLFDKRLTGPLIDLAKGFEKTAEVDLIAPFFMASTGIDLYRSYASGDQNRFKHILVDPLNTSIPLGVQPWLAKGITQVLFPSHESDLVTNNQTGNQMHVDLRLSNPDCEEYDKRDPLQGGGTYKIKCAYDTKTALRNLPLIAVLQSIMSQISSFQAAPANRFLDENDINMILPNYGINLSGRNQIIPDTNRQVQLFEIDPTNGHRTSYFSNQILIEPNAENGTHDLQRSIQFWLKLLDQNKVVTSGFSITLNINNAHWIALNLNYEHGQVTWQVADSNALNDPESADTTVNVVQHMFEGLSNINSGVYFTQQPFEVFPNNYQSAESNNCGLFALAYLKRMLNGEKTSDLTNQDLDAIKKQGSDLRGSHNSYSQNNTLRLVDYNAIKAGDVLIISQKKKFGYDVTIISQQHNRVSSQRYSGNFKNIQLADSLDLKSLLRSGQQGNLDSNNIYFVIERDKNLSAEEMDNVLEDIKIRLDHQLSLNDPLIKAFDNTLRLSHTNRLDALDFLPIKAEDMNITKKTFLFKHGMGKPASEKNGFELGPSSYTAFQLNINNNGSFICGRRFDSDKSTDSERREIISKIRETLCPGGNIRLDITNQQKITQSLEAQGIESVFCELKDLVMQDGKFGRFVYDNQVIETVIYTVYAAYYGQRWALNCGAGLGRTTAMLSFALMILSEDYNEGYYLAQKYHNYLDGIREDINDSTLYDFSLSLYELEKYIKDYENANRLWSWIPNTNYQNVVKLKNQGLVAKGRLTVKGRLHLLQAVLADLRERHNLDYKTGKEKFPGYPQLSERKDNILNEFLLPFLIKHDAKM